MGFYALSVVLLYEAVCMFWLSVSEVNGKLLALIP